MKWSDANCSTRRLRVSTSELDGGRAHALFSDFVQWRIFIRARAQPLELAAKSVFFEKLRPLQYMYRQHPSNTPTGISAVHMQWSENGRGGEAC
jgi:hypothetical protein